MGLILCINNIMFMHDIIPLHTVRVSFGNITGPCPSRVDTSRTNKSAAQFAHSHNIATALKKPAAAAPPATTCAVCGTAPPVAVWVT